MRSSARTAVLAVPVAVIAVAAVLGVTVLIPGDGPDPPAGPVVATPAPPAEPTGNPEPAEPEGFVPGTFEAEPAAKVTAARFVERVGTWRSGPVDAVARVTGAIHHRCRCRRGATACISTPPTTRAWSSSSSPSPPTRSPHCNPTRHADRLDDAYPEAPMTPRIGRAPFVLAIVLAAAGCSTATPAGPDFAHVHGLGIDPADGSIRVATHDGLFRSGPDGLVPVGTDGRDLMGFTVAGPGVYLSSGHPGPDDELPDPLGLLQSRDGGTTWTSLSLTGDVDFHALEVAQDTVFGYDATYGLLRVSTDGGRTWADRATINALDIAVDPDDPNRILATVEGGVATSTDGGDTFGAPDGPQLAYVSWAPGGVVYGLGLDSTLFASDDGGSTWEPRGTVPGGRPQAITATGDEILAATAGGVHRTVDGFAFTAVG